MVHISSNFCELHHMRESCARAGCRVDVGRPGNEDERTKAPRDLGDCASGGWAMILERERELGRLAGLLDEVAVAGGRVALVRGEAGMGKSALVHRFVEQANGRAQVLMGSCDDLLTPQPFGPIWDVARDQPAIARQLTQGGDGRAVMEALLQLLSREHPTVLIIEDTQWADEATLDAIKFLGRRVGRTNGVLLLTFRDGEVDADHPLRQVIGELRAQNVVRIQLQPLSAEAIAHMIGDHPFSVDEVLGLTGGNPLFVTEVLASGVAGVTSSIQDSVLARASKVSPTARRLLHLVSVIPGAVDRGLLGRLMEPSADDVNGCVQQGLLEVHDGTVSFRHELQRRAVEASLAAEDRRNINKLVLDALGGEGDPARVVHHAREAGDVAALVEHAPLAARSAMAIGSQREAVAHFRTLEDHTDRFDSAERAGLLEDWARAESYLGDERAVQLVTDSIALRRALGDDEALARALTFAVSVYERNGLMEQATASAHEAVAMLNARPPSATLAAALTQQGWLLFMRGTDDRRALELADEAIRIADDMDNDMAAVRAMIWKGAITHNMGDREGFSLVEEAHQRAAKGGFRYEETIALVNLAGMSADVREIARASDLVRRAHDTAARYEIRALETYTQAMHAEILLWQGDWEQAEDTATAALDGPGHAATVAWRILGQIQARRGRSEAGVILERVWSYAERSGQLQQMDPAASVMAEYAWLAGDHDERRLAIISSTIEQALAAGPPWPSGALAFWSWKLGLLDSVPKHTPEYYRAIVDSRPEVAAEFWRSRGVPYEEAVALMHGTETDKRRAIELFDGLDAAAAADRVRLALRAEGVSVPRGRSMSTRSHAAGLTTRQAEVLDLLAEGLSNPQIADRLFISHRTVENHVAAVLMKLDVPDRHSAADVARDRGLVQGSTTPGKRGWSSSQM